MPSKIRIRLKGYDTTMVEQAQDRIIETAQRTGARVSGPIRLPTRTRRWAVLTGPTLQDQKEHFEIRTHKRLIEIRDATPATVNALQRLDGLPTGVDIQLRLV
nr:30S ribosomal protein S10 [Conexibacter woesei]